MEGTGIVAARAAVERINEETFSYVVMSLDANGNASIVSGGDIGGLAFLQLSFQSLCLQIVEGRDPRGHMPHTLRPVR